MNPAAFLMKRLLVSHTTRSQMDGKMSLQEELGFKHTHVLLRSQQQSPRIRMVPCSCPHGLHSELGGQTQAPTVQEFESQSQPLQSNHFSLKLLLPPRDCMKFKFPVNHRQAVSRSHYSPGHISSMGKINKVKIQQKKIRKSQQNLRNFPYDLMTYYKISDT